MATYTATQLKDYTSVQGVQNWSDDKILLYQAAAEQFLDSLLMDTTMTGYSTAYQKAVVFVFDWFAENPTGLRGHNKGKIAKTFGPDDLPLPLQRLLQPFIDGSNGTFTGTSFIRNDIGTR